MRFDPENVLARLDVLADIVLRDAPTAERALTQLAHRLRTSLDTAHAAAAHARGVGDEGIGMTSPRDDADRPVTVLVADDEPLARRRILRLLRAEPGVEVVAECKGGRSAVEQIRARNPDLVFLDIQMPDLDGFGVIAEVGPERMPSVVFVTAFDQYALRAFEVHALDYLLKPFEADRFHSALVRARANLSPTRDASYPGEDRLRRLLAEVLGAGQSREGEPAAKRRRRSSSVWR